MWHSPRLGRLLITTPPWQRILRHLRWLAHWRCFEPVVVIESDDWGLERRPCSHLLKTWGKPSEWSEEETGTAEDLERLYRVLERHKDALGRTACFTANVVLSNPDFDRVIASGYAAYHHLVADARVVSKLREGMARALALPQYQGMYHFSPNAWLRDLQANTPGARELAIHRCHGGLALLRGQGWRYHSEYIYWWTSCTIDCQEARSGLELFEELFGFRSISTIAPHYILPSASAVELANSGIQYVQGMGYRILRGASGAHIVSHSLGERLQPGLLCLTRTVRFEPRPQRPHQGVRQAVSSILRCFQEQIPAVIDTHRINYTGRWGREGSEALDQLLGTISSQRPRFLTSAELGEAIRMNGLYRDTWTGQPAQLTPVDPGWRKRLRALVAKITHWCVEAVERDSS